MIARAGEKKASSRLGMVVVFLVLIPAGCASALRPLGDLEQFSGSRAGTMTEFDSATAERNWELQTIESVTAAATAYRRAAGGEPQRTDLWVRFIQFESWLADHLVDRSARRDAAAAATEGSQWCLQYSPADIGCRYWQAVAIGVQAREKKSTGLDALPRMIELLEAVAAEDPAYDRAGAFRVQALVYLRAPEWPTGLGDAEEGLDRAERAIAVDDGYAPNWLALGEALQAVEELDEARNAYRKAEKIATEAVAAGNRGAEEWLQEARRALVSAEK